MIVKIEKYQKNLKEFLSQIKKVTERFSIKCSCISQPYFESLQKDNSKTFCQCFRILGNKNNILTFQRNIGFRLHQNKIKKLNETIKKICGEEGSNLRRRYTGRFTVCSLYPLGHLRIAFPIGPLSSILVQTLLH